jgi:hypothetical protein
MFKVLKNCLRKYIKIIRNANVRLYEYIVHHKVIYRVNTNDVSDYITLS